MHVVAVQQAVDRLVDEVRDQQQKGSCDPPLGAVRSLVAECVRDPVKRQMIVTEAKPSTKDDAAQMLRLNESASKPAAKPTTPSIVIHTSDAHDSRRAAAAARSQPASRAGAAGAGRGTAVTAIGS